MRWVICALVVLAFAPRAVADDFDVLRGAQPVGPATFTRWSGFYVGGQFGYSDAIVDFSGATHDLVAYSLRDTTLEQEFMPSTWPILGSAARGGLSAGAFVGYDTQWQDLVLGVEGSYNYASLKTVAPSSPIGRVTPADSGGSVYELGISGTGSLNIVDFFTLRTRAGYVIGNFLPYGFAGLVVGQANVMVTTSGKGEQFTSGSTGTCTTSQPCYPFAFSGEFSRESELMYGFALGGGVDVALTPNIFLRSEFEYIQFAPLSGIVAGIASARVGAGLKF